MRVISLACAAIALATVSPAMAGVVFTENFDAENGGLTALNFNGFTQFSVTGQVDLTRNGDYYACAGGSGSCVDLDGSSGPGTIISSVGSFSFGAGDTVRLTFDLSGNQRNGGTDDFFAGFSFGGVTQLNDYGYDFGGGDTIIGDYLTAGLSTGGTVAGTDGFLTRSIFFTAGTAGSLTFSIGTNSGDNIGPVVDNISLDVSAGAVPEPATWGMMLLGFGLVGAAVRRPRRTTAHTLA